MRHRCYQSTRLRDAHTYPKPKPDPNALSSQHPTHTSTTTSSTPAQSTTSSLDSEATPRLPPFHNPIHGTTMQIHLTEEEKRKRALRAQRFARDKATDPDGTSKFAPPKRTFAHQDNLVWSNKEEATRSFLQRKGQSAASLTKANDTKDTKDAKSTDAPRIASTATLPRTQTLTKTETDIDRLVRAQQESSLGQTQRGGSGSETRSAVVDNLNLSCTEGDLRDLFRGIALERIRVVRDDRSGEMKGCAYIDFAKEEELSKALKLNGIMLLGKPVRIEASSRREAPRGNDAGYVLPIRNLSKSCVDADIMHFFQGLDVTAVEVSTEPESGKCTGAARVRFGSKAAYEKALKYEGMMLLGRPLRFDLAAAQGDNGPTCRSIQVSNLSARTQESDLVELFKGLDIRTVKMNLGVVNSNSVSSIIEFTTPEFAQAAEKYNGILLFGRTIKVECLGLQPEGQGGAKLDSSQPEAQPRHSPKMTVFVSNLDFECKEADLDELFKGLSIQKRTLAVNENTGESKGYGYVDFQDEESVHRALERDKTLLMGRKVSVSIPQRREPLDSSSRFRRSFVDNGLEPSKDTQASVFVGNLNPECTPRDLTDLFRGFPILNVYIAKHPGTGYSKEFGYVDFADVVAQRSALEMDGVELLGRHIIVKPSHRSQGSNETHQRPSPPVCFDFQKGDCLRGSSCRFAHDTMHSPSGSSSSGPHRQGGQAVCFAFQEGTCFRGERCKFRHVPSRMQGAGLAPPLSPNRSSGDSFRAPRKICFDYQRGMCSRSSCKFAHEMQEHRHPGSPQGSQPGPAQFRVMKPCFDFQRGSCSRGTACRYQHGGSQGGAGSGFSESMQSSYSMGSAYPEKHAR